MNMHSLSILTVMLTLGGLWSFDCMAMAQAEFSSSSNFIIAVEGKVSLKRQGWSHYVPVFFGVPVRTGDLIKGERGSKAIVACFNLNLAEIQSSGINPVPCPPDKPNPFPIFDGNIVAPTRADIQGAPIVISPRKTFLLNDRPMLRWKTAGRTTDFTLSVRGPGVNWTSKVRGSTELRYPADAPRLVPGQTYVFAVATVDGSSEDEGIPDLGFEILPSTKAAEILESVRKIRSMRIDDQAAQFLIAQVYASSGLLAEALDQLEAVRTKDKPAVVRAIAEIYRKVGLNRLANDKYQEGSVLSKKVGDTEGEAIAELWLGIIDDKALNSAESEIHLKNAFKLYSSLGGPQLVSEIQKRLTDLRRVPDHE